MATLSNTDLRNGVIFKDGSEVFSVIKYEHNVRGRGSSIVRVKLKNLSSGAVVEKTYRENDKVESVDTQVKGVQYLYSDEHRAHFMEDGTFEQREISLDILGDQVKFLKEGEKVKILLLEGKPVSVEIPKIVELKIKNTGPDTKGDTVTNAMKEAILENDLQVKVPMFSKNDDVIRVNTDTGEYVSRVQKG